MRRWLPAWLGAPRLDPVLLVLLMLIMGFGLFVLYSASGQDMAMVERQAVRLGFGVMAMLANQPGSATDTEGLDALVIRAGCRHAVGDLVLGVGRGTQRWLDFGLFRFQPSELMKLAVPMMVAWYLHPKVLPPDWKATVLSIGYC